MFDLCGVLFFCWVDSAGLILDGVELLRGLIIVGLGFCGVELLWG